MNNVKALTRLWKRLSTNGPGITVAVIAMLVALTGVAFAAAGALTGKQKREVNALIKKSAKPGPAGTVGPPGPKGDVGAKGDTGSNGAPGKSVLVTPVAPGEQDCADLGGALVEKEGSGSPAEVCNGEEGSPGPPGAPGAPGSPWTAGGTLPAEGMLTGSWMASGSGEVNVPLNFPIHLAGPLESQNVYYGSGEEEEIEVSPGPPAVFEPTPFQHHCLNATNGPAGSVLNPGVVAGSPRTLCIYFSAGTSTAEATFEEVTRVGGAAGGSRAGAFLKLDLTSPGTMYGTYAISGG